MRLDFGLDIFQLVHQLFVNVKTSGCIKKHIVMSVVFCKSYSTSCDINGVDLSHFENGHARLFADNLKLFDCRRTVNVAGNKQGSVSLIFEHQSKLCAVRGFTRALKTAHHDDCRRVIGDGKSCLGSAHEVDKLLIDDFDNHLRRRKAFHNLCADCTLGNGFGEVLGNLIVNVGLQKSKPHLTHCVFNVAFGQCALAYQLFKSGLKSV